MDISSVNAASPISPGSAAWAGAGQDIDPANLPANGVPAAEPVGEAAEAGLQVASLQSALRPQAAVVAEPPRPADSSLPVAEVGNGFALPADQLLPVMLIGLQVQASDAWPMTRQHCEPLPAESLPASLSEALLAAPPQREEMPCSAWWMDRDSAGNDRPAARAEDDAEPEPAAQAVPGNDQAPWCETLTRSLNDLIDGHPVPAALLAASEQWQRGRCVVLACPQGLAGTAPGWAFVLWPRRRARGPLARRLSLQGQRVEARLQWAGAPSMPARDVASARSRDQAVAHPSFSPEALPPQACWCQVRAVKEHLPRGGRQIVALDDAGTPRSAVPCELQLGPVRAHEPRWREVLVRIDAVGRFWAALGGQWSVLVVVSSQPLAGVRALQWEA